VLAAPGSVVFHARNIMIHRGTVFAVLRNIMIDPCPIGLELPFAICPNIAERDVGR
jgi:hypothetical protein